MEFMGYRRANGAVGVRNHVAVMPGVLCASTVARKIAAATGATYVENPSGCGQCRSDQLRTLAIMSGLVANPNVASVLIVGLGCEQLQEQAYRDAIESKCPKRVEYMTIYGCGGVKRTFEQGCAVIEELKQEALSETRVPCDLSSLILGLECGASDPTSGISSNVVLGAVSDRLVDAGATAILTETPECIGAEEILRTRGATPEVGERMYQAVCDFEQRFAAAGEEIRAANPSPGNKRSGLTTLEEKSLGCIHKSGTRPFSAMLEYGDWVTQKGLLFMDTTGFDAASVPAKVAAGAQIVAFTTGLGSPVGNPVAPVVKITGNGKTARMLDDIIDFDTSASITGEKTVDQLADELLAYFLAVASGETVCAELNGFDIVAVDHHYGFC